MSKVFGLSAIVLLAACALTMGAEVSSSKSLHLTVYNDNYALVRDVRTANLSAGINSLDVEDVAAEIDPASVLFKSLTAPNSVIILEQNYQYDLINPENILKKSVGQRVTFTNFDQNGNPYHKSGILLNPAGANDAVIKTEDGSVVLRPWGQISVEKMPSGLKPKPTLNWLAKTDKPGAHDIEISYITNGIGWKADYAALLNANDTKLDLSGWVTLNNSSGASYKDAKLTLMAGDVRRVQEAGYPRAAKLMASYDMAEQSSQFKEKSFFEYHMYAMDRKTTIAENETKQLALLNVANAPVKKEYIYDGRKDWWLNWWYAGRTDFDPGAGYDTSSNRKVNVVVELKNSAENRMGMPLPKGKIRVYKLDDDGSSQFIGEDVIDHTPKDEKIRLYIGDAFDIVGEFKRVNYKKIDNRAVEESFQINIRNHKKEEVEVKAINHVWSDWTVTAKTHPFNKRDAQTIEFPVKVPANGEVKINYTVLTKW